jgi:methylglutaconyl-CoA hydratase
MNILLVREHDGVEVWTLNRPDHLNAFNKGLLLALNDQLDRLEALTAGLGPRAVVLTGAGGRAFSAGADLKERKGMPASEVPAFVTLIGGTFDRIARAAQPFVAAVNGYAFGGGMEIALACDIRVVSRAATMGLTETRLAIIPGAGGTQRLPRLVGTGRAKDLILTGRRISAEEAHRIGLAEHLAEPGATVETALSVAAEIASCGPLAVRAAKAAIDGGSGLPMARALEHERACYDRTLESTDRVEALVAFAEKRKPVFEGR